MYDKILVPLDGSMQAESVLRHVEELALQSKSRVLLLRVVDLGAPIGAVESAYASLRRQEMDQATREARAYLAPLQGQYREKGIEANALVAFGRTVDAILDTAESENVDLIVLANHGQSGLARVVEGSVAAGLLQRARRPLLVIPSHDQSRVRGGQR
jgi:nucleotide-binding universal stress UspA family protein